MICPACTSRLVAEPDRDAATCELCGWGITGFKIAHLRGSRRGRFWLWMHSLSR